MRRGIAHCISHTLPSGANDDDDEYVTDSQGEDSQINSGRKRVGGEIDQVSDSENEENAPGRLAELVRHDKHVENCAAQRKHENKPLGGARKQVQRGKNTLDNTEQKRLFQDANPSPDILKKKDKNPSLREAVVPAVDSRDAGQKEPIPENIDSSTALSRPLSTEDSVSKALGASLASVDTSSLASSLHTRDMNRDQKRPVTGKSPFAAGQLPRRPFQHRKGMTAGKKAVKLDFALEEEEVESFLPSLLMACSFSARAVAVVDCDMVEGGSGRGRAEGEK